MSLGAVVRDGESGDDAPAVVFAPDDQHGVRASSGRFGVRFFVNLLGPFDRIDAVDAGCAYFAVYCFFQSSWNVESLLSGGVVDEWSEEYERFAFGGGGVGCRIEYVERERDGGCDGQRESDGSDA